jgi:hypothetical protein
MLRILLISLSLLLSCKSILPTPLLIGNLIEGNNQVHSLYQEYRGCKEAQPKEECGLGKLEEKIKEVQSAARFFIGGDISQPHGYDIYLQVTLIYFSVSEASKNELTEAELISRQFFEVQKASSGRALDDARYYWALVLVENITYKLDKKDFIEVRNREVDILLCLSEAKITLDRMEPGPKLIRLLQAIQILTLISKSL